jgi:hypothetical protein
MESEVQKFVIRLFRQPEDFLAHVRTYGSAFDCVARSWVSSNSNAGAIIILITHGYVVDHSTNNDYFIRWVPDP